MGDRAMVREGGGGFVVPGITDSWHLSDMRPTSRSGTNRSH
jgi:hypothetical protein